MTQSAVIWNPVTSEFGEQTSSPRPDQRLVHVNEASTDPMKWSFIHSSRNSCSVVFCYQFTRCLCVLLMFLVGQRFPLSATLPNPSSCTNLKDSSCHRESTQFQVQLVVRGSDAWRLGLWTVSSCCSYLLVKRAGISASLPVRILRLAFSVSFVDALSIAFSFVELLGLTLAAALAVTRPVFRPAVR